MDILFGLKQRAKQFKNFKDFSTDYSINGNRGIYYHFTSDPNFTYNPNSGARDMSSIANGNFQKGSLMVTSDFDTWNYYYNYDQNDRKLKQPERPFVAIVDLSDITNLQPVQRGFGHEIYLDSNEAKKAKILKVLNLQSAKAFDRRLKQILPKSEEKLKAIWEEVHGLNESLSLVEKILKEYTDWGTASGVKNFLTTWVRGSTHALNLLTPEVIEFLQNNLSSFKSSYTLYRGFWYASDEAYKIKRELGNDFNKLNGTVQFQSNTPTSWTFDLEQAKRFSDPFLNTLTGKRATYNHFSSYDAEEILGYSFLIKHTFSSDQIIADLTVLPSVYTKNLGLKSKEKECIVLPGKYQNVELLKKQSYTKQDTLK